MNHPGTYNISNEHLLLVDILNSMYNDNIRQINSLNSTNTEIRNLLIQILNNNNNTNLRRSNNHRSNNHRNTNTYSTTLLPTDNLGRIVINSIPYVIESIEQVRPPSTRNTASQQSNEFSRVLQSFFEPVDVYPTSAQIETATRRVRYCDIVSPKNVSCPISLTNFNDNDMVTVIRHCGHIFNTNELNTWFRSHCNCPVCRYDIRNDNSNASSLFADETRDMNTSSSASINRNNQSNFLSTENNIGRNTTLISDYINELVNDYTSQNVNNDIDIDSSANLVSTAILGLLNLNRNPR